MKSAIRRAWQFITGKLPPLRLGVEAPSRIIQIARSRGVVLPDVYYGQMQGLARTLAFSIAGINSVEQLDAVKGSLDSAFAAGESFEAWRRRVLRGEIPLSLPRHRLETIFRTNLQTVYSRGKGESAKRLAGSHPYLLYSAVNDSRTRPAHKAMNGTIRRINDPWWATHRPPNGYNCRCTAIQLTEAEARRRGITDVPPAAPPDPGWEYDPWADPRRGMFVALRRWKQRARTAQLADKVDQVEAVAVAEGGNLDPDQWRQIGPQRGSNPGGLFETPTGERFYVKFYADTNQARSEVAAMSVYRAMGVDTLEARIVEMARPGGGRATGMATRWRDDLSPFDADLAELDDLARVYHGSVLTANWDVAGLSLDNLALNAQGRIVILDAGGTFRFRAQGGDKPFTADAIVEATTLRSARHNQASARAFASLDNHIMDESFTAMASLDQLNDAAIEAAIAQAGFDAAMGRELATALRGRRALLRDRYDLDGKHSPKGQGRDYLWQLSGLFGPKLQMSYFKDRRRTLDATGHETSDMAVAEVPKMVDTFKRWLRVEFDHWGLGSRFDPAELLRGITRRWSGSSSSQNSAIWKLWAADRWGVKVGFHDYKMGDEALALAQRDAASAMRAINGVIGGSKDITMDQVFELLDAEWAFNQILLRRMHGWNEFPIIRWMSDGEARGVRSINGRDYFSGNALASYTTRQGGFSNSVRLDLMARAEYVAKVWQQGADWMHFYDRETEYVTVGGLFRVLARRG